MIRILSCISFLCISVFIVSCGPQSPILLVSGITQIGPSNYGLQHPIWSPNGRKIVATNIIAMQSLTSEIYIIDISTNKIRSIEKTDYGNIEARSWSPDGNRIAFSSELAGDWPEAIWLIDSDGMTQKQYLAEGYDAAWSPDGNSMAIFSSSYSNGNETRVLSTLDLKTMNRNVVFSETGKYLTAQGVTWSPDGTRLMFSFGKQENDVDPRFPNVDINILKISTKEITKITNEGVNSDPNWSPDGNLITYITNTAGYLDSNLIISNEDGSCNRKTLKNIYSADWSPDGKQLALEYEGNIYLLDLSKYFGEDFQKANFLCP
jgi:Tol biopolymer transport system component